MRRHLILLVALLAAMPLAAQTIVFDAHLDLPKSAAEPAWTGRSDAASQLDLDKARKGGRDAASLAAAAAPLASRDTAIHDANPKLAGLALSPADLRRIVAD